MKRVSFLISLIALVIFVGCDGASVDNDSELPTIEVVEPVAETMVRKDTLMRITAYFRDNIGLKSCTMGIGDVNGDVIPGFEYSFTEAYANDGEHFVREYTYGDNIDIPDAVSIESFYIHYTAIDQNDNTAVLKYKILVQ